MLKRWRVSGFFAVEVEADHRQKARWRAGNIVAHSGIDGVITEIEEVEGDERDKDRV